jgi:uncharacterized membrane protein YhfC
MTKIALTKALEAFCRVAASRSDTRRPIHWPSIAALHALAEMPTALFSVPGMQTLHVALTIESGAGIKSS